MSARLRNNQPTILILADFSDGSWQATSFAMQFLYRKNSPVTILQTYQNPGWGHLMMRKLSHHLKKITKNELRALKNRLLTHFKVEKQKINTLSVEGELNSVLNFKPIINGRHNLVLSTHNSFNDSCKRQNGCLETIINTAQNPLFILPERFEGETSKRILFIGSPGKKPSEQLCSEVHDICKRTQSNLEILLVFKSQNQKVHEDLQSYYHKYFEGIDFTIRSIQHKTKCRGINNYLQNTNRDLIVIEND
ncbi:hypothetical protein [Maribellus maritimus]|uniref:hypothetical protein n=1 Tax=Maribellus maritimus TaxID=2870838 RepID=UPI001EECEF3D|nr:hypothetical protein [Maribellus maritimus]MCG6191114.1 hypothetical protein [Maribellus maritimus]